MLTESIYILFCLPDLDPVGFGTFFMHDPAAESTVSAATHHASSICPSQKSNLSNAYHIFCRVVLIFLCNHQIDLSLYKN